MHDALGNPPSKESMQELQRNAFAVAKMVKRGARELVRDQRGSELGMYLASAGNEFIEKSPGRKHWACTRGCAYCCSLGVPVTPPEAFFIARVLKAQCSAEDLAEITSALEDRSARANNTETLADYLAAKIPCAFLTEDQSCSIHDFRPIACKGYASFSRDSCRSFAAQEPGSAMISDEVARVLAGAALAGFVEALTQAHLDGEFYELHGAILVAMREGAEKEWLAGGRVFSNCSVYTKESGRGGSDD